MGADEKCIWKNKVDRCVFAKGVLARAFLLLSGIKNLEKFLFILFERFSFLAIFSRSASSFPTILNVLLFLFFDSLRSFLWVDGRFAGVNKGVNRSHCVVKKIDNVCSLKEVKIHYDRVVYLSSSA